MKRLPPLKEDKIHTLKNIYIYNIQYLIKLLNMLRSREMRPIMKKKIIQRNRSRNEESSMVIELKMSGAWINDFLLCWLDANRECVLRKT